MSSHHFVKEDQEPALVIADASGISMRMIEQLLEWSPTVIVLEQSLDAVVSWGIKIDVVVSHVDRVKEHLERLSDQAPVKVLSHNSEDHPLGTAMMFLTAGRYKAVNVIGASMAEVEPYANALDLVTFHSGKRWSFVRSGKFEKWLTKGTQLTVGPDITHREGIDDGGNVVQDGFVRIHSSQPFWVGERMG